MSGRFNVMEFLRRTPPELLQAYCRSRGIPADPDWATTKKVDPNVAVDVLRAGGDGAFEHATADFRLVWDLHGPGFTRGILNEAKYHRDREATEALEKLTHLGKAFWAVIERSSWIPKARASSDVDKLPPGAWIRRNGLPARPGSVDKAMVEELESQLVAFFKRTEHRGGHCLIDAMRRGEEEVFYALAEDHPDSDLLWQDGRLQPHTLKRSFRLVFKHHDKNSSLDIYVEGSREVVPDLQVIFARAILGEAIPREDPAEEEVYAIERILERGFGFDFPTESNIADVRITKMRFRVEGGTWRRFMAEADTTGDRDALATFVEGLRSGLPKSSKLVLDQVCLQVTFHKREGDRRAPSRMVYITHPHALRTKMDELGEKIVEMLTHSGIVQNSEDAV